MYPKGEPLTTLMLSPVYIREATAAVRTADTSVEVNRYKGVIPTVDRFVEQLGSTAMEAAIKAQLVAINVASNASRPMSEAVIDSIAPILLDFILNLEVSINMADFRIVFDRAIRGDYGKIYGGIGCQDVCGWFKAYESEKMAAIDRYEERIKQGDFNGRRSSNPTADAAKMHEVYAQYLTEKSKQSNEQD